MIVGIDEGKNNQHCFQKYRGMTLDWLSVDSEEHFQKNCNDNNKRQILEQHGWLDTKISYSFNQQGFRDEEFDQRESAIALGCSHTQGIGIRSEQTWAKQLETKLGIKVWNLGIGGASLSTCFRMLDYWIDHLNVKYVFCAVPEITRYEVFVQDGWMNVVPLNYQTNWISEYHKNYISSDENSMIDRRRNLMAMKHVCSQRGVPFYIHKLEKPFYIHKLEKYSTVIHECFFKARVARDLMHEGPESNIWLADIFYKMCMENQNAN
jgi:hypothetical protein